MGEVINENDVMKLCNMASHEVCFHQTELLKLQLVLLTKAVNQVQETTVEFTLSAPYARAILFPLAFSSTIIKGIRTW